MATSRGAGSRVYFDGEASDTDGLDLDMAWEGGGSRMAVRFQPPVDENCHPREPPPSCLRPSARAPQPGRSHLRSWHHPNFNAHVPSLEEHF